MKDSKLSPIKKEHLYKLYKQEELILILWIL